MQQQMAQQQQILLQLMQQTKAPIEQTPLEQILDSLCGHIKEFRYDEEWDGLSMVLTTIRIRIVRIFLVSLIIFKMQYTNYVLLAK